MEQHKLSSVQVNLPKKLANEIIDWGHENVPDSDVYENPGCGREDEMHVTVFYGIKGNYLSTVSSICKNFKPFTIELRKISLFNNKPDFDVLKIEAFSHDLHEIHREIKRKVNYLETFPEYNPHVTIAYIKKGKGWKHEGDEYFNGKLFNVNTLFYSDKSSNKYSISLG